LFTNFRRFFTRI